MSDVLTLTLSGTPTAIVLANHNATLDRCTPLVKGGIPELQFSRILGKLTTLPDPWSGVPAKVSVSGTTIFVGDVQGYVDRWMDVGWVREYRALGLRNRADYVPNTDAITLTDTSLFNLPPDDPSYVAGRAGQNVGQIVTAVLTMTSNATPLNAAGIGAYSSMGPPPVLPSLTVSDLSALTVIPQQRVSISGERILQSIEAFIQQYHPNHWLHVQPDGTIRLLDMRAATAVTITIGTDPRVGMPSLTRDYSDCFSQVIVRGNTLATPIFLQTLPWPGSTVANGGLVEAFAYGVLLTEITASPYTSTYFTQLATTSGQAIAGATVSGVVVPAWVPSDYQQPGTLAAADDTGTLTVVDSLHVNCTSSNTSETWSTNQWNTAQATMYLYGDLVSGISQFTACPIVANAAMTAGATASVTLGVPLTSTQYASYKIWGLDFGPSIVFRKYKIVSSSIAAALLNYFPYPVAVSIAAIDNAAWLTSSPQGFVQVSETSAGGAPYVTYSTNITVDPVGGYIYFTTPTAFVENAAAGTYVAPFNVMALLAVASGQNSVTKPTSGYSGTLYTVEGVERTKIITVQGWTDPTQLTTMTTFAQEQLDALSNVVVEGTLPYYGLMNSSGTPLYLTCGTTGWSFNLAGNDSVNAWTTGWEALALPIVGVELVWNNGADGTSYQTNFSLSNRRGRYTADSFLRPSILGHQLGLSESGFVAGGGVSQDAANPMGSPQNFSAINPAPQSMTPPTPGDQPPPTSGGSSP